MQQHVYDSADISYRVVASMSDNTFDALMAAYKRGAYWWCENQDADYLDKAAYDYADKVTSESAIRAEQAKPEEDALGYATRLITIMAEKHFPDRSPEWKPLPDVVGILTQIDNMLSGMVRAETAKNSGEPVAYHLFIDKNGDIISKPISHTEFYATPANSRAEAIRECERAVEAQFDWSLTTREVELLSRCRTALRALLDKEPKP